MSDLPDFRSAEQRIHDQRVGAAWVAGLLITVSVAALVTPWLIPACLGLTILGVYLIP